MLGPQTALIWTLIWQIWKAVGMQYPFLWCALRRPSMAAGKQPVGGAALLLSSLQAAEGESLVAVLAAAGWWIGPAAGRYEQLWIGIEFCCRSYCSLAC